MKSRTRQVIVVVSDWFIDNGTRDDSFISAQPHTVNDISPVTFSMPDVSFAYIFHTMVVPARIDELDHEKLDEFEVPVICACVLLPHSPVSFVESHEYESPMLSCQSAVRFIVSPVCIAST